MEIVKTLLSFTVVLGFSLSGQLLLKKGVMEALNGAKLSFVAFTRDHLFDIILSPYTLAGLGLSAIGLVCWLYVISTYEVSRALPILGGMGYIALFVLGRLVLDESTTVYNLLGILLLICGVALLV